MLHFFWTYPLICSTILTMICFIDPLKGPLMPKNQQSWFNSITVFKNNKAMQHFFLNEMTWQHCSFCKNDMVTQHFFKNKLAKQQFLRTTRYMVLSHQKEHRTNKAFETSRSWDLMDVASFSWKSTFDIWTIYVTLTFDLEMLWDTSSPHAGLYLCQIWSESVK